MIKWIRSEMYSKTNYPVYFHPSRKYALVKEKYPLPHWCLIKKINEDKETGYIQWDYVEHFLSNIKFNDAKRWLENSKYNKKVD